MRKKLESLWITETIRLVEKESGRFDDEALNREVRAKQVSLENRIIARADLLAKRNGLAQAFAVLLSAFKLSFIVLLFCALLIGCGLAFGVLSQNPVNLYWALFGLLGIHLVTLAIWFVSFFFTPQGSGSLLIHAWLWLAKKITAKQVIQQMVPAFISLFATKVRWLIGFIVNFFWTVLLSSAFVVLLLSFSTKQYSFEWKTTLLSSDAVIELTQYLGALPALLGFSIPNDALIKLSEHAQLASDVRSSWAIWLLGVFLVYGLLVRSLIALFCGVKWLISCRRVTLDLSHREYQILVEDLQPLTIEIIDHDTKGDECTSLGGARDKIHLEGSYDRLNDNAYLVAIDIEESWIPPREVNFLGFLNTGQQRTQILDYLQLSPAKKLLIAIDTDRTPDRGILNLIELLMQNSEQNRIWQINEGKQLNNWNQISFKLAKPVWLVQDDKSC